MRKFVTLQLVVLTTLKLLLLQGPAVYEQVETSFDQSANSDGENSLLVETQGVWYIYSGYKCFEPC